MKASKNDVKMAKALHSQEVAKKGEVDWSAPVVNYEQRRECLMFWVKLPGLHHADVCVDHDAAGNASINLEATPKNDVTMSRRCSCEAPGCADAMRACPAA
jgi:hypothetical protein